MVRQDEKSIIYYRKINQDDIIIEIHALNVAALYFIKWTPIGIKGLTRLDRIIMMTLVLYSHPHKNEQRIFRVKLYHRSNGLMRYLSTRDTKYTF